MTLATRIIPCLDVDNGRVVKGVNFQDLKDAGDPVELAKFYAQNGADELTFLDISASRDNKDTMLEVVKKTADVDKLLRAGADKVSINTSAINNPELINQIAQRFGSQVLVISIDARRSNEKHAPSGFEVTTHGGTKSAGLDALAWTKEAVQRGAGEVLLNSMDKDGTKDGFDLELIKLIRPNISVPLIASGGAGKITDFYPAVIAGADALLAASVFHFKEIELKDLKAELKRKNLEVRD
jgi:cyclase